MYKLGVLSEWIVELDGTNTPKVFTEYSGSFSDRSGTPALELVPVENMVAVECFVDDTTYTTMQSDPDLTIVWYEEIIPDEQ